VTAWSGAGCQRLAAGAREARHNPWMTSDLDYGAFDALTFDCYGTLIDWESGILAGLRVALAPHGVDAPDDALLEAYAAAEARLEGGPFLPYRTILAVGARSVATGLGVEITDDEAATFGGSVGDWPAFEDSTRSLRRLRRRFKLGVLTNCDDDLFAASSRRLDVEFDWVVTAQQVGSYKPSPHNFEALRERLRRAGIASARILHVAQSLYHDHVPARRLGFSTVWIDRRHDRPGSGATPAADASPSATFVSMADFAAAAVPDHDPGRQDRRGRVESPSRRKPR
jgi:2-haloacid dehalogenase